MSRFVSTKQKLCDASQLLHLKTAQHQNPQKCILGDPASVRHRANIGGSVGVVVVVVFKTSVEDPVPRIDLVISPRAAAAVSTTAPPTSDRRVADINGIVICTTGLVISGEKSAGRGILDPARCCRRRCGSTARRRVFRSQRRRCWWPWWEVGRGGSGASVGEHRQADPAALPHASVPQGVHCVFPFAFPSLSARSQHVCPRSFPPRAINIFFDYSS